MEDFYVASGKPTLGMKITKFVRDNVFSTEEEFTDLICKEFEVDKDNVSYTYNNNVPKEIIVEISGIKYVVTIVRDTAKVNEFMF